MAKYRLQFTKYGDMKYVSHLDLIRLFTRIFHRADLPICYSEGFNPHPKMAVLLPLSVGFESACEYIDVEFRDGVGMLDCMKKLKGKLPLGMEIPQITQLNETSKKAKAIRYASYEITFENPPSEEEIEHAQRVVDAEREASAAGIGVFTVDNKMVDYPIINKAKRILIQAGRLEK